MSGEKRLIGIRAKIERAEKHILDLNLAIESFLKSDPYRAVGYDDLESGERVVKFRIVDQPPPPLLAILGDAIHCLRSSLDHLACQLVDAVGGKITNETAFPIAHSVEEFESARNLGKIKGADPCTIDLIKKIEPYKGGKGDIFWRLHMLDITDKHRLLITTAAQMSKMVITGVVSLQSIASNRLFARGEPARGPLKDGQTLISVSRADRTPQYEDPQFSFYIVFGERFFEGQPLVPQLLQLVDLVKRTVEAFLPFL